MHGSSLQRMAKFAEDIERRFAGQAVRVLDVGSGNVLGNMCPLGDYRQFFSWEKVDYVGLDIAAGPNVDVVPKDPYDWRELEDDSFDVVISGQAFEHIEFPWLTIEQIARKLRPGGLACLVMPSRGPEHRYPIDCYRYYPDGLAALAKWAGLDCVEGSYIHEEERFPDGSEMWGDASCILSKPLSADVRRGAEGSACSKASTAPAASAGVGVAVEGNPQAARFNPCDYPLCWTVPSRLSHNPAINWIEHIPFAFALVQMVQPRCIVELGVQVGDSFLAFCQAVKTLKLEASCHGIDPWQGDGHTGDCGPEVLRRLQEYHDPRYGGFSRLVQSTFDEAARSFPDGSVDLLHIDGWHTYETLRRDFETWQPKLSSRAIVLFHDTNIREYTSGVVFPDTSAPCHNFGWRLWQELSAMYPHFEFAHGNGLGVLVYGKEASPAALQLAALRGADADAVRYFYFTVGHTLSLVWDIKLFRDTATELNSELVACRKELAGWKLELTQRKKELALITGSRAWRFWKCLCSLPVFKQVAWHMMRKKPRCPIESGASSISAKPCHGDSATA